MNKPSDATLSYAGFLLRAVGSSRLSRPGHAQRSDAGMTSLLCSALPGDPQDDTDDWFEAVMADAALPAVGAAH